MYHTDAGLHSLGRSDEVAIAAILEEGMSGTKFWLRQKPNRLPWHSDPPPQLFIEGQRQVFLISCYLSSNFHT